MRVCAKSAGDMLKNLGADLLKYSADVSVRLKTVVEQSKEVEASSVAQLEAVLAAVAEMEASAAGQAQEAREVMADGVDAAARQVWPRRARGERRGGARRAGQGAQGRCVET